MIEGLICWKCGTPLDDLPQPLSRRAECPNCHAELHTCRLCRHFDTAKAKQCREPVADEVQDKTRANFCDWFQPKPQAQVTEGGPIPSARAALDALFGKADATAAKSSTTRSALDRLFGEKDD